MDILAASELFPELNWSNIEPCLKFKSNLFWWCKRQRSSPIIHVRIWMFQMWRRKLNWINDGQTAGTISGTAVIESSLKSIYDNHRSPAHCKLPRKWAPSLHVCTVPCAWNWFPNALGLALCQVSIGVQSRAKRWNVSTKLLSRFNYFFKRMNAISWSQSFWPYVLSDQPWVWHIRVHEAKSLFLLYAFA